MDLSFDHLDVISREVYAHGAPHDVFTELRRHAPVVRHRGLEPGGPEWFWVITRHADVVEVSRRFQVYSSAARGALINHDRPDLELARMMIDLDPPEHTRLRTLVQRGFTPKAVKPLAEHFTEVGVQLVGQAIAAGEVEFVQAVSSELPLIAIAEFLGIPAEDRHKVFDWSNRMIGANDPDYGGGTEDATNAAAELYMYANALAADRRAEPRADIITTLISEHDGDVLSEHEFDLFVLLLSVAGNETTRNGISHGVLSMIEHPDAWAALKADPSLVPSAIEEILRWSTPVHHFRRTATCDVELHGEHIKEGDAVVMMYASANRDEHVFADPFTFDITRNPNPHVTFGGGGPHFCLGANLARLEMKAIFDALVAGADELALNGEVTRLQSNFVNGIKRLPISISS